MKREFTVLVERDSDGWHVGSVPEFRGCHTQAKSLDELAERMREAIAVCLEDKDVEMTDFVGIQRVAVET